MMDYLVNLIVEGLGLRQQYNTTDGQALIQRFFVDARNVENQYAVAGGTSGERNVDDWYQDMWGG